MANYLGNYDPDFLAAQMLIALTNRLGLANTVFRGYDATAQQLGSTIKVTGPAYFTASDVNTDNGGTTQNLNTRDLEIKLDKWKEVKYKLTDKELTYTKERIITDHIGPAAYAVADQIDRDLASFIKRFPTVVNWSDPVVGTDITKARKALFNQRCPMDPNNLFLMVDGDKEAALLSANLFISNEGSGDAGVNTQINGMLGRRYGFNIFANQNTPSMTSGTATDLAGAVNNANGVKKGAVEVAVDGLTASSTFKAGDLLVITGDNQKYAITEDVTLGASATSATFKVYPPLAQDSADDAVVTFTLAAGSGATKSQCFAYHRNAMALAMAPLSTMGAQLGDLVSTAIDPVTGLAIRSTIFSDADHSQIKVKYDALYGIAPLDPALGCRIM